MTDLIGRTLHRLNLQLPGRVFLPGNHRYAATAIWAKSDHTPRAVVHCQTTDDVQAAIRAARSCDLPLSVRGGGHDWAGRALCDGLVIDLSGMNRVDLVWPKNWNGRKNLYFTRRSSLPAPELGRRLAMRLPRLARSPIAARRIEVPGIAPWAACDHAAS